ncbi:DUF4352 domain-containing protein [Listeria riparia]|uniref:DUF4352 domain-containing protein n=1 Tax=Listeria riparia TaxID=1494964 RepID=UPI00098D4E66
MLIAGITASTLVFAGACGNTEDNQAKQTKTEETVKQTFKTKTVNNIDMKIGDIKTTESVKKDKNMVSIAMSFLNNDSAPVGVGAGDFKIKSGDKTYDIFPQGNNFGDEFKPNEKLTGKAYFELPKNVKNGTLLYAPMGKEQASWSITIPEAK